MKDKYLTLEKLSQDLDKQGKSMFKESPKEYYELSGFRIILFDEILWRRRKQFAFIMEKFVNDSIYMEQFETEFSLLYWRTDKAFDTFKNDLKN
jgi:hypothetical protein